MSECSSHSIRHLDERGACTTERVSQFCSTRPGLLEHDAGTTALVSAAYPIGVRKHLRETSAWEVS